MSHCIEGIKIDCRPTLTIGHLPVQSLLGRWLHDTYGAMLIGSWHGLARAAARLLPCQARESPGRAPPDCAQTSPATSMLCEPYSRAANDQTSHNKMQGEQTPQTLQEQ
eukprot:scaffold597935_cov38-Prasinocladus_malaysianus.AAC.1